MKLNMVVCVCVCDIKFFALEKKLSGGRKIECKCVCVCARGFSQLSQCAHHIDKIHVTWEIREVNGIHAKRSAGSTSAAPSRRSTERCILPTKYPKSL